ncbi:MAG: M4 family metallopeptidase [Myxococcota bacterium]
MLRTTIAAVLVSFPATALAASGFGYALADQPTTASYSASRETSFSTAAASPLISRGGVGQYAVRFPGLGVGTSGGHVQVAGFGSSGDLCKVASWSTTASDLVVNVRCFAGTAAHDSAFMVMVTTPEEGDLGLGYAWADQPTTASYSPNAGYAHDAAGGAISITRSAVGRYAVRFPGLGGGTIAGGTVQVTPYGPGSERCQVVSWSTGTADLTANIACFTAAGVAVDTRYDVLVRAPTNADARLAFAWADQPTAASYTPSSTWSRNPVGSVRATRSGVGTYAVTFAGQANAARSGLHAQVSAYGSTAAHCVVSSAAPNGPDYVVGVRCAGPAGALDSRFTVLTAGRKRFPGEPLKDALAALDHASDRPVHLQLTDGTVRAFSGAIPSSGTDPLARALAWLEEYRALFGLTNPSRDLFLSRSFVDERGTHLFFNSRNNGRVVMGAELAVLLDATHVTSTRGFVADGSLFTAEPTISAVGAETLVSLSGGLANATQLGTALPVAFDPGQFAKTPTALRPAWRVIKRGTLASGTAATIDYLVDGLDGSIVRATDLTRTIDFDVWTANHTDYDPESCVWMSRTKWFTESGVVPGATPDADGLAAYDANRTTFAAFARLGRTSIVEGGPLTSYVHFLSGYRNAFFDPSCGFMAFGDGMVATDVFAHEVSHAISSPYLAYQNDVGALNESYSDIFGAMVDGNWTMGESIGAIRDLSNPPRFGQPDSIAARLPRVSVPAPENDFGFVHTNSGIHNKVAYLIADGGTHRGVTVAPIGRDKTWRLFYSTLPTLTRFATFEEAREATLDTALHFARIGLYSFVPSDVCSVADAFASVGLGSTCDADEPPGEGDHIPAELDNCRTVPNPDQRDSDGDGVGDACDGDADNDGVCDSGGPLTSSTAGVPSGGCVAGPSGRDNCPLTTNPGQADTDGDGRGEACDDDDLDGVFNDTDNCPGVRNRDQRDFDRDGRGDACDLDNDDDGRNDTVDNCPRGDGDLVFDGTRDRNASQADFDGDGVGDLCDHCVAISDPENVDTDGDRTGDVCDLDDDNDAVCDAARSAPGGSEGVPAGGCTAGVTGHGDNCRTVSNPDQIDLDHNGTGIRCDSNENFLVSGDGAGVSNALLDIIRRVTRIPIAPCFADGCPDWLDLKYLARVTVVLPAGFEARIIDSEGARVASGLSTPNGVSLEFHPRASAFYRFPRQQGSISATGYFLELVAPANFPLGSSVPLTLKTEHVP